MSFRAELKEYIETKKDELAAFNKRRKENMKKHRQDNIVAMKEEARLASLEAKYQKRIDKAKNYTKSRRQPVEDNIFGNLTVQSPFSKGKKKRSNSIFDI